jgi:hypothetical protein
MTGECVRINYIEISENKDSSTYIATVAKRSYACQTVILFRAIVIRLPNVNRLCLLLKFNYSLL